MFKLVIHWSLIIINKIQSIKFFVQYGSFTYFNFFLYARYFQYMCYGYGNFFFRFFFSDLFWKYSCGGVDCKKYVQYRFRVVFVKLLGFCYIFVFLFCCRGRCFLNMFSSIKTNWKNRIFILSRACGIKMISYFHIHFWTWL